MGKYYKDNIHYVTNEIIKIAKEEKCSCSRLKILKILLLLTVKYYKETEGILFKGFNYNDNIIDNEEIFDKFKFFASYDIEYSSEDKFNIDDTVSLFIELNYNYIKRLLKMMPWDLVKYYKNICLENIEFKYPRFITAKDLAIMSSNMERVED